jgi:hypothetical protein
VTASTAALEALSRVDDGLAQGDDLELIEILDRHLQWEARPCLVCGGPLGPECTRCHLERELELSRLTDI